MHGKGVTTRMLSAVFTQFSMPEELFDKHATAVLMLLHTSDKMLLLATGLGLNRLACKRGKRDGTR